MSKSSGDSLDAILETLGPLGPEHDGPQYTMPITIWVPVSYKEKYDKIQRRTKRKFSMTLKEVLMSSIDKVVAKMGTED